MTPERLREIEEEYRGRQPFAVAHIPELIAAIRSLTPTWAHEAPTVEGWYWYEHPGDDEFKDATQICNVVAIDDVRLFVWFIGEFTDGPVLIETLRGRWSDKSIPMPVEPGGGR